MKTPCYIFDLDGTLSDCDHRRHFVTDGNSDWDAFYEACDADDPHEHIITLARRLYWDADFDIFILSGRSDAVREKTEKWLAHHHVPHTALYMRKADDHRPDEEIKLEWLNFLRGLGWNPLMAFDDRNKVVAMWRANGVPCAQVAQGDF